jgi:hypothetical protein
MEARLNLVQESSETGTESAKTKDLGMWVVWYGDDTAVYRLRVNSVAYEDLYATLRQSLAQDQMRLESIAGGHISAMLAPIFAGLPSRLEPFLDDLFSVTNSASLMSKAVGLAMDAVIDAAKIANKTPEQITVQAGETTRIRLADQVVTGFRDAVLLPGFTLRALRGAGSKAFLLLRQDLLENCDRYDRAFRSFVLNTPGTVESREGELGWRPDPSWQQGNATFLSLCPELRRPSTEQMSDTPLIEAFAAAEEIVQAQALELVRPLTDTAVDVAIRSNATATSLNWYGLPSGLANFIGTGMNSLGATWTIVEKMFDKLGGTQGRERFAAGLLATLKGLETDSIQRMHSGYRTFVTTEIERIGLNLAARSEGVWSHHP